MPPERGRSAVDAPAGRKRATLFKACGREQHLVPVWLNWVAMILTTVLPYHVFSSAWRAHWPMAGKASGDLATCQSTRESITQHRVIGSIIEPAQSGRTCPSFDVALSRIGLSSTHRKGPMSRMALRD